MSVVNDSLRQLHGALSGVASSASAAGIPRGELLLQIRGLIDAINQYPDAIRHLATFNGRTFSEMSEKTFVDVADVAQRVSAQAKGAGFPIAAADLVVVAEKGKNAVKLQGLYLQPDASGQLALVGYGGVNNEPIMYPKGDWHLDVSANQTFMLEPFLKDVFTRFGEYVAGKL